jgi:hypothetical protein
MSYALLNKRTGQRLEHPRFGLWYTSDFSEAEEMLAACKEWLAASNMTEFELDFVIIDTETGESVTHLVHG